MRANKASPVSMSHDCKLVVDCAVRVHVNRSRAGTELFSDHKTKDYIPITSAKIWHSQLPSCCDFCRFQRLPSCV